MPWAKGVSNERAERMRDALRDALHGVEKPSSEEIQKALAALKLEPPDPAFELFLSKYDWATALRRAAAAITVPPNSSLAGMQPPERPHFIILAQGEHFWQDVADPLAVAVQNRERARSENNLWEVAHSAAEVLWWREYRDGLIAAIQRLDPKEAARLRDDSVALATNPYLGLHPPAREEVRASVKRRLSLLKKLSVDHPEIALQVAAAETELSLLEAAYDRPQIEFAPSRHVAFFDAVVDARASLVADRDSRLAVLRAFQLARLQIDGDDTFEPAVRPDAKADERPAAVRAASAAKAVLPRQTMTQMTREQAAALSRARIWAFAAEALGAEASGVVARSREAQLLKLQNFVARFLPEVAAESVEEFGLKFATNEDLMACKTRVAAALTEQQRRQLTSVSSLGQSSLIPARIGQLRERLRAIEAELDRPKRTAGDELLGRLFARLYAAGGRRGAPLLELKEYLFQGPTEALRDYEGRRAHYQILSLYQIDGTISPAELHQLEQDRFEGLAYQANDLLSLLPRLAAKPSNNNSVKMKLVAAQRAAAESISALDAALADVAPYFPERAGRLRRELKEALPDVRGPPTAPGPIGISASEERRAKPYRDPVVSNCSKLLLSLPVISVRTQLKPGNGSGPRPGIERHPHYDAQPSSAPASQPP